MALAVHEQVLDAVAAIDQVAFAGNDIAGFVLGVADDVADLGKSDPDAGAVVISKAFLDIVFFKERVGDICIVGRPSEKSGQNIVVMEIKVVICHKILHLQKLYTRMQLFLPIITCSQYFEIGNCAQCQDFCPSKWYHKKKR